jgi:hypothetical protein
VLVSLKLGDEEYGQPCYRAGFAYERPAVATCHDSLIDYPGANYLALCPPKTRMRSAARSTERSPISGPEAPCSIQSMRRRGCSERWKLRTGFRKNARSRDGVSQHLANEGEQPKLQVRLAEPALRGSGD